MRQISLKSALEGIRSSTKGARTEGLSDFEHLLRQKSQSSQVQGLSDKDHHNVLETLFATVEEEREKLLADGSSSNPRPEKTRERSVEMLVTCSYAVRIALEIGAPNLKSSRTVRAVLDHVLAETRRDDGQFFDPLLDNYFKALVALLRHRPHIEHLTEARWLALTEYCCEGLQFLIKSRSGTAQAPQVVPSTRLSARSRGSSRAGTPAQSSNSHAPPKNQSAVAELAPSAAAVSSSFRRADDLSLCLDYLCSIQHVNILQKADDILSAVFETLQPVLDENRPATQQPCFSVINKMMLKAMNENVQLARTTFSSAVYYIRRGWNPKIAGGLRDQMLITLMRGQCLMPSIVDGSPADAENETLSDLDGLLDRLLSEYQERMVGNMLQVGDIGLALNEFDASAIPFSTQVFCVRGTNPAAEASWVQLSVVADLFHKLRIMSAPHVSRAGRDSLFTKRPKYEKPLHSLIRSVSTSQREEQLSSLQFLVFVLATVRDHSVEDLQMVLENLFPLISKDVGQISSWAMLAMSVVCRNSSREASASQDITWLQIFQVSVTKLSSARVARFACHLTDSILTRELVSFSEAADSLDGVLTSVDVSGPAGLSDSAIGFWRTVLALYSMNRAASYENVSGNVLRWLFGVWRPSQLDLRSSDPSAVHATLIPQIMNLLQILVGEKSFFTERAARRTLSALAHARRRCDEDKDLTDFLLLDEVSGSSRQTLTGAFQIKRTEPQLSSRAQRSALTTACDYLNLELEEFLSTQDGSIAVDKLSQLNLRNSLTTCIISLGVADILGRTDLSRSNQLLNRAIDLRDQVKESFFHAGVTPDRLQGMREALLGVFQGLRILPLKSFKDLSVFELSIVRTARAFTGKFWQGIREMKLDNDEDMLEAAPFDESQDSRTGLDSSSQGKGEFGRDWLGAYSDDRAFKNSTRAEIHLAGSLPDPVSMSTDDAQTLPTSVVDYLLSLNALDFLSCRSFLDDVYASKIEISAQDGEKLLTFFAMDIFESEEFERNETAIGTCVDLMNHLVRYWAMTDMETDISDAANQLYEYFVRAATKKALTSHVQIKMAHMLLRVIKKSAAHGRSSNRPSARTNLFRLLENGNVKVKYKIGQNIAAVFGFFLLGDHDKILDDIEKSIPHDPDSLEITAVRLSLLSHLASSWSTLIRRCVYAIVDATGLMGAVTPYAHVCLRSLGKALGMHGLRNLFRLFAPQILYTWLDSRTIASLPFSVFEYGSLEEMATDVKHEIAAQMVMRGKEDEIETVVSLTGSSFQSLLEEAFGKCAAYCIARDTAVAPEADPQAAEAARRLRHHVGSSEYKKLLTERFPDIVATFFKILDREDQITKSFQKNPSHALAQKAFEQMVSSGASQNTPPVSQQPSFRSNCLIDELEYICQRSPYESRQLWTPAIYVFVCRNLLETIHPALGQLHAAAVIRRIRILVSMAGSVAFDGYALEVTLGSLRVHLDNTHSAEDVIGLYRYLMKAGEKHLGHNISFVTGFIVSVLVSLKALMDKPQESTTQESTFRATLERAQDFHAWITDFASSLDLSSYSSENQQAFRDMVKAASNLRGHGSSSKDTAEGDLLLRLLYDDSSDRHLVDEVSRKEIVVLLCKDFRSSGDYRNDILSDGSTAASQATSVMQLYGQKGLNRSFDLWILRVLGRSYASSGFIEPTFQREIMDPDEIKHAPSESESLIIVSATAVVQLLYQVACAHSTHEAGFAERTIQSLLSKAVANDELKEISSSIPSQALPAMDWQIFTPPPLSIGGTAVGSLQEALLPHQGSSLGAWCTRVCLALIQRAEENQFLADLCLALEKIDHFAVQAFPYILHLVLFKEIGRQEQTKVIVSAAMRQMMLDSLESTQTYVEHLIKTIIYLRSQPMPYETTKADRAGWLDVDYRLSADVAARCGMFKTALLFVETALSHESVMKGSRRSSAAKVEIPTDLLLHIFQSIDEKDYYYGVRQPTSLSSMMDRLDMEQAGFQSLSFRGASFDVESRRGKPSSTSLNALIKSLNGLELSSLSQAIAVSTDLTSELSGELTFDAARKLEKWDIPCPDSTSSPATTLFKAFQVMQTTSERAAILANIDARLDSMLSPMQGTHSASSISQTYWSTLAALVEIEEVLSSKGPQQLQETWEALERRGAWLRTANSDNTERILSSRETLFGVLNKNSNVQQMIKSPPKQTMLVQVKSLLESSGIHRSHGNLQKSLATATAIEQLLPDCKELGLKIEASVRVEVSDVLWDNGEMASSIRILQDISHSVDFARQDVPVSKPELLAKLANRVSEARLEQPDEILARYLEPAVKDLKGNTSGDAAGRVFHEFAAFCDQQLQNPEATADFHRAQKLRDDKADEIRELDQMIRSAQPGSKERENYKSYRAKAKQWYDLDNAEFKRLQSSRDTLLKQSLENYLKCLKACDSFDRDAIRFSALWLEHHDEDVANEIVSSLIGDVSSRKFATLMNQWTSRLLEEDNQFQKLLSDLIYRICAEHPYHGMYNIFASSRSKGGKDQAAMSRHAAANAIVKKLRASREIESRWLALHNSCVQYVRFASERPEEGKYKQGTKVLLEKSASGIKLQEVIGIRMPPATMNIDLRKDCNYKNVPVIVKWSREFSVASGISAPKIVTATASNGQKYKELFKAGNDDLRQDAIMEQVFEQVSKLLVSHRETRRRRLGIRSYKVLPLTAGSGIIEFVSNTIPINDYLVPAHNEHYPNDIKASAARKIIHDAAASRRNDHRVMEFRRVCERMHPVLRYFFMERFENPDDWFEKRLNYTRTTAAVSMLGHILGLGDRHGHNILLDEKTGEVVHIDLGIAFEQGRILPVPELVPFRLTRDIVDGFGVTKTEGVFRRCCEFTLDALRKESYSIMTILDVLRYDPLYSWSLSPLRLKRLQEDKLNDDEDKSAIDGGVAGGSEKPEKKENEEAEADRALTVVAKKLSKGLSVEATVNELIQQASDERNLALLFAGWAAYI